MQRCTMLPRNNWQSIVESQGLSFHTEGGVPYWDEAVFYEFQFSEIEVLRKATDEVHQMCLHAVQYIIENRERTFPRFSIPIEFYDFIAASWEEDEQTVFGRLDFVYDGVNPPKLLEYNADTPTTLLESSVIQHHWLKDTGGNFEQFNSIHERLIEAFERIKKDREIDVPFYLASLSEETSAEDYITAKYLFDASVHAGLDSVQINIENVGYCEGTRYFLDSNTNERIEHLFKLYPWEWLFREEFGQYISTTATEWYEPAWKCILSNKAILPYLSEIFGDCPYILKSSFNQSDFTEGVMFASQSYREKDRMS